MRNLFLQALFLELVFAAGLAYSTCLLRADLVHAINAVRAQPASAAARAELLHQQRVSQWTPVFFGAAVFGMLAVPTAGAAVVGSRFLLPVGQGTGTKRRWIAVLRVGLILMIAGVLIVVLSSVLP